MSEYNEEHSLTGNKDIDYRTMQQVINRLLDHSKEFRKDIKDIKDSNNKTENNLIDRINQSEKKLSDSIHEVRIAQLKDDRSTQWKIIKIVIGTSTLTTAVMNFFIKYILMKG